ncbi:TetR family transcriptional regulator [Mycobacterium kyorinense]|uniref:TetR family transcriptional regulator n=1 Tax=Mycobacterium kyorinense TaxID=487514 RepID=A0A1A2Z9T2_9MYCO|nr:TetR/AcrR family transcriptional regulator [Mycobacterium kyorinense]OBI46272.1 TetR family transcriptional regulator [Mycobacterium kyorinense]
MLSISNASVADRILAGAASCVRDFGVERVTLAEIARRAGVSRPTVYRRWPDTQSILADLLTARIAATLDEVPPAGKGREALVDRVVALAERLRDDELVMALLRSELAITYFTQRLGTSQQVLLETLAENLNAAQRDGSVRPGDPRRLAAMVLLITQSTVQSAQIVQPVLTAHALADELRYALNGYLS